MMYLPYTIIFILAFLLSLAVVPILLLTKWEGYTTIFGNKKYGRKEETYWKQFLWLVFKNPVNNLCTGLLSAERKPYILKGSPHIGDKVSGGRYFIHMGNYWEYYRIIPYRSRCVRLRFGWKIEGKLPHEPCGYVLFANPVMKYDPPAQ